MSSAHLLQGENKNRINLNFCPCNISTTTLKFESYAFYERDILLVDDPVPIFILGDQDFVAQKFEENVLLLFTSGSLLRRSFGFGHFFKGVELLGRDHVASVVGALSGQALLLDLHLAVVLSA